MKPVLRALLMAVRLAALTFVLTGIVYPLLVTGLAQLLFPGAAGGSLVTDGRGLVIGSELLAQPVAEPGYFQPRPSAAGDLGYGINRPGNPAGRLAASGGSNLAPTSARLRTRIDAELARRRRANPSAPGPVPAELVTASGSGLDPHLGLPGVMWQIPRVAAARRVAEDRVRAVVMANLEDRTLGFLGEPRVNVLLLNLALDRQFGTLSGR